MLRPLVLSLLFACDPTVSKSTDDTSPVEDGVCVSEPTEEALCAGRATDLVISSREEALAAVQFAQAVVELQSLGALIEDVATSLLAEQDAGLREICLEASDDPETGTRIYEGDCAAIGVGPSFSGRAAFTDSDGVETATFVALSARNGDTDSFFEADGSYTIGEDADVDLSSDLHINYNLGYEVPITWTLVTEVTGTGDSWHQVTWAQLDSHPDMTLRGAWCAVADLEPSATCDAEPDGTLTVVGAQRWDLVVSGSDSCDDCTEVHVACEAQEDWCPETDE